MVGSEDQERKKENYDDVVEETVAAAEVAAAEDEETLTNPCRCTFAVTGAQKTYQAIFICRTCCDGEELLCICEACANHCHELHDELEYLGMGQAYCDCACLGPNNKNRCKLAKASEQEIKEWNFSVGSLQNSSLPPPQQQPPLEGENTRHYIMDAFQIQELQSNTKLCRNLVEQASELVTHSKDTFWLDHHQDPHSWCDLEQMAWRIYEQHKDHYHLGNCSLDAGGGAEWWVQVKTTDPESQQNGAEAVDLHYDKDESLAEKFGLGSFPTLSTVTYLTESSNPTVIFSRTYEQEDDDVIPDMLISHPVMGKHLVFDGRLLHGAPAHVDLRASYLPLVGQNSGDNDDKKGPLKVRVTLLVNIWNDRKPAGVHPLDQTIRDIIKKKFVPKKIFKKKTDFSRINGLEKVSIEERRIEAQVGEHDETRRIQLPFVCKGITWESEDDDSSGLVLVTCPPPEHTSDTLYVRFGAGLQAYLDQPYDAIQEGDGLGGAFDGTGYVYEDAYI